MVRRKRRKRNRQPTALGALLGGFLAKKEPEPTAEAVDETTWRRLVGVAIAKRTRPVSLARGVLLIQVGSSAWAQQLSLLTDSIRERLADKGLAVRSLRFRVGTVEPLRREPDKVVHVRKIPLAPLPEGLKAALAAVADVELRTVLAAAAGSNLAWQEGLATARRRVAPALPRAAGETAPPGSALPRSHGGRPGTPGER